LGNKITWPRPCQGRFSIPVSGPVRGGNRQNDGSSHCHKLPVTFLLFSGRNALGILAASNISRILPKESSGLYRPG
jgi:hypothetical protein